MHCVMSLNKTLYPLDKCPKLLGYKSSTRTKKLFNRQQRIIIVHYAFNPFKLNGISHSYQVDQSISILRIVGWYFSFYSKLTHLCQMILPTIISRTCPFPILGVLDGIVHFCPNFNVTFCKQTVETLIRRRILGCLIWVCTVCLCPIKRALGFNGLRTETKS